MKSLWIKASVLAAMCAMLGCADDSSKDTNTTPACTVTACKDATTLTVCTAGVPTDIPCPNGCEGTQCKTTPSIPGATCTTNSCKDAMTLTMCFQGTPVDYVCPNGCENSQCKSAVTCTTNTCKDATTLQVCNGGQYVETACPFGCSNGACMASQGTSQCSINVCQDADVLLACSNGIQVPTVCPYGCEAGNCKTACTGNVCKDSNTLLVCQGGKTIEMPCQLGCDAGQCKMACTSNFCMTPQILMSCSNGILTPVDCPYGCEGGACRTSIPTTGCTNGSRQCDSNGNAQVCENGVWQTVTCANGCVNGACMTSPSCTNGSKQCDGNGNALICANGTWQSTSCPFGCNNGACLVCENGTTQCKSDGKTVQTCNNGAWADTKTCDVACSGGACTSSTSCTNGTKQCNGVYVQTCTNGQWVNATSACENGCENGACKSAPSSCTNGAKQCNGAYVQTCTNGQWVNATSACPNGCTNGVCNNSSTLPPIGDSCSLDEFANVCDSNTLYYCGSSVIKTQSCTDGMTCKVSAADPTNGDCTELCSASEKGSVGYYYCYNTGYSVYSIPITCMNTTDGDYAYFFDFDNADVCSGGCSETQGCGGSSTGNYEVCDSTCYVNDDNGNEVLCSAYCNSIGSNVCYMDDVNLYCYDPNGTEPGGDSCDYFDCTSLYSSSDCALGTVLCDAESAYCVERDSSYDSQCTSGGKAYFDQNGKGYCLNVGNDESCLSGGGTNPNPGTESDIYLGASCTSAQLNQKMDVCAYDSYYDGYFTDYLVCMNHEQYGMIWYTYTGTYDECNKQCNSAGTACDSSGSTSHNYNLN